MTETDTIVVSQDTIIGIELMEHVGISNEGMNTSINLYPVPVKDRMFIDCPQTKSGRIRIIDLTGRIIHEQMIMGNTVELDVSGYCTGIYIVELNDKENQLILTNKFLTVH